MVGPDTFISRSEFQTWSQRGAYRKVAIGADNLVPEDVFNKFPSETIAAQEQRMAAARGVCDHPPVSLELGLVSFQFGGALLLVAQRAQDRQETSALLDERGRTRRCRATPRRHRVLGPQLAGSPWLATGS